MMIDERHPILRATPCSCNESRRAMVYKIVWPNLHMLKCQECKRFVIRRTVEAMIERWNDRQWKLRNHK
ncbi:hypothetical protein SE18_05245 [Herpetosiphon geysericola]|uniref:Uncharacterized protein n=1 Tax=Herpetosiphon geysericola TaxID=70996 RepID=A0A0P6Z1A4_9CHLR|nr:hypothetical protein SE18_05245 [Herpetosiphon geysericola]